MAEERPVTPEKQLLKLIEDPKINAAGIQAEAIKHYGLSLFSPAAWSGRISFFKEELKKSFQGKGPAQLDAKLINQVLTFFIFFLVLYFLSTFFVSLVGLKKVPRLEFKASADRGTTSPQEVLALKKAAAYYLEKVTQRDIFRMGEKKTDNAAAGPKAPSSKIIEATQNLKLVGISWSNDPDVMIEDAKAGRTFFVKRGQTIGEIKVQAIFKDRVVLSYDGEEIELR
jgi:type II secretory pathway component PulC